MKTELKHGATIETCTPGELRDILAEHAGKFISRRPQTLAFDFGILLDGSGNSLVGTESAYKVPLGLQFTLHRVAIAADSFTPIAPYTNAGGYITIRRRSIVEEFILLTSAAQAAGVGGIPFTYARTNDVAIKYVNGDELAFGVFVGPASKAVTFRIQGTLEPVTIQ